MQSRYLMSSSGGQLGGNLMCAERTTQHHALWTHCQQDNAKLLHIVPELLHLHRRKDLSQHLDLREK